ncbi:molybdopterin molybdochelatase [Malonomonas rubra DSM 5091]|uniref:Molybdopterin molybdenumtransferase n=1 Tax=Malonomonas rubra DSM 5091 TaxID=1122189 RepID=A0A1M6JQA2_MALRU|nr:gephyrin-like molybdotransferase Glp [Malonomonas rubra]SHJ48860.1 molybdopterin molybdochelatase [Malonomonas rubra DSM 5091]
MYTYYQARNLIVESVQPLAIEKVSLLDAAGRAVAEDIVANQPLPLFDNSAMDGYAVRAEDCESGVILPVQGYIPAGGKIDCRVEPGTAVKIMTGAPVPPGADAIVPFEETEEGKDKVTILGRVKKGDHIRWKGEDIKPGDKIIDAGTVLRPAEISLLASFGMSMVKVCRRVRVAILSTGDELQELDELRFEGGIINSNSWALAAALREIGAEPLMLGIARDNIESLREKMRDGLQADVLITSAGVSAGDRDYVREVLEELGVEQKFWKINIKPGKPTAFGMRGDTPVFSLPGNPVSTMITFEEFVRPALLKMMGHRTLYKPLLKARLQEPVKKKYDRLQLMRVAVELNDEGELMIASAGDQNTGILRTMIDAQAIALLAPDRDYYAAGDSLDIHLLGAATALGY